MYRTGLTTLKASLPAFYYKIFSAKFPNDGHGFLPPDPAGQRWQRCLHHPSEKVPEASSPRARVCAERAPPTPDPHGVPRQPGGASRAGRYAPRWPAASGAPPGRP